MTKLIITNSCKDGSSLPPERLCSSRCDLPLFQRRQFNWKQLTRIKPEVVTYSCGLVLSLSIWRSHTLFYNEKNALCSYKIQTCPAYSFFFVFTLRRGCWQAFYFESLKSERMFCWNAATLTCVRCWVHERDAGRNQLFCVTVGNHTWIAKTMSL